MKTEPRTLVRLCEALAGLAGAATVAPTDRLSEIGFNSIHLVELMLVADSIYGFAVPFEELDFTVETTVEALDAAIAGCR